MVQWQIHKEVAGRIPGAAIGFLEIGGIRPGTGDSIWNHIDRSAADVRSRFTLETLYEDIRIAGMRTLYRKLGIDPARYRPSSERLLRRILQGKDLYRVNPVVDACNLASIECRIPLGLYDVAKVKGKITLRFGKPGESYRALTGNDAHVENKFIVADEEGPIGSPTTDGERTKVLGDTGSVLLLSYAPPECGDAARQAMDMFALILGGEMEGRELFREIRIAGT